MECRFTKGFPANLTTKTTSRGGNILHFLYFNFKGDLFLDQPNTQIHSVGLILDGIDVYGIDVYERVKLWKQISQNLGRKIKDGKAAMIINHTWHELWAIDYVHEHNFPIKLKLQSDLQIVVRSSGSLILSLRPWYGEPQPNGDSSAMLNRLKLFEMLTNF
jgi:hypothetical protein